MLKVYNSLTDQKEDFKPVKQGEVKIYSCGPTVYDYFHIGNARAFIVPDIIKRYLSYRGYEVFHVLNFTDIDDKMIKRANKEEISVKELAARFITAYFEDTEKLNIKQADFYPKATDYIKQMQEMVKDLIEKGHAYREAGDVYFAVDSFADYGKLSSQNIEELKSGARVEVNQAKKAALDFTLWKESKEGEPAWPTPWGVDGRPGWHIECSVMAKAHLGDRFDIHTGGVDLKFPHHENEIAQSEAYCGHSVVNYWLHNGYINIDGEKMSKSLGNFFTTREVLKKYSPETVRLFLISKHYRSPINFSDQELDSARSGLQRLKNISNKLDNLLELEAVAGDLVANELETEVRAKKDKFIAAMDDDFNTALALGVLYEMAGAINSFVNSDNFKLTYQVKSSLYQIRAIFTELSQEVLGLELKTAKQDLTLLKESIDLLLELREEARESGNYQQADQIRDRLVELGVNINDTPQGVEWSLKDE